MTVIRVRHNAPESQSAIECSLCGRRDRERVKDHLVAGTPGATTHDGAVCEECGQTLDRAVQKFGCDLTVQIEEGQVRARKRDTPRAPSD
jgi:hypothetical protein